MDVWRKGLQHELRMGKSPGRFAIALALSVAIALPLSAAMAAMLGQGALFIDVPLNFSWTALAIWVLVLAAIVTLATWTPLRRAAAVPPAHGLRYEQAMPRPKLLPDEDVISLAREVILSKGTGVSTVEIAAHVGLSQPTLFQRFGDKETLLRLALTPDPICPEAIIGSPEDPTQLGVGLHVANLAGRLFDVMVTVLERTQLAAAGGLFDRKARGRAHAEGGADILVPALAAHFSSLGSLRVSGDQATETLLFLVHGAAAMALADPSSDTRPIRDRLAASTRSALVEE